MWRKEMECDWKFTSNKTLRHEKMECDWKFASNKIMQHKEIGLFTQYHDS